MALEFTFHSELVILYCKFRWEYRCVAYAKIKRKFNTCSSSLISPYYFRNYTTLEILGVRQEEKI